MTRARRRVLLLLTLGSLLLAAATGCRVMTWNVNGVCAITDYNGGTSAAACRESQRSRQSAIRSWARTIAGQGHPQVIGLQEICNGPGRHDLRDLVARLTRGGPRYRYYFQSSHSAADKYRHCGNAILSIHPLRARACRWLATEAGCVPRNASPGAVPPDSCSADCRVAISAIFDMPTPLGRVPVRVFNAHIAHEATGSRPPYLEQALKAGNWINSFGDATIKFVTGDFQGGNFATDLRFQPLRAAGFSNVGDADGRTPYTSGRRSAGCPGRPTRKADFVMSRGLRPTRWGAPCVPLLASDHFPLWGNF